MLLKELFGNTARIKIIEELISKWGIFLSVEEISRMADVSKKTAYINLHKLEEIGILEIKNEGFKKYKLKEDDKRSLALGLIESEEYLRKANNLIHIPYHTENVELEITYETNTQEYNKELLTTNNKTNKNSFLVLTK